jgi:hypothetical protein
MTVDNKYPCPDCGTLDTGRAGHFDECAKNTPAPPRETTDARCPRCDRECGRVLAWRMDRFPTQGEVRDCEAHTVDWRARALASEDARRKAEELKDSYKAERDEYAKSATALRAQLATVTAERDALHGKLLVANAGWDSSQNSLVLAQTARARAEAALATMEERVRELEAQLKELQSSR